MTNIFETEPYKAYNKKYMALRKAEIAGADASVIKTLKNETVSLKTALVEAESKRCGHAVRPNAE